MISHTTAQASLWKTNHKFYFYLNFQWHYFFQLDNVLQYFGIKSHRQQNCLFVFIGPAATVAHPMKKWEHISRLLPRWNQGLWHTPNRFVWAALWSTNRTMQWNLSGAHASRFSARFQVFRRKKGGLSRGWGVSEYQVSVSRKSTSTHPSSKPPGQLLSAAFSYSSANILPIGSNQVLFSVNHDIKTERMKSSCRRVHQHCCQSPRSFMLFWKQFFLLLLSQQMVSTGCDPSHIR